MVSFMPGFVRLPNDYRTPVIGNPQFHVPYLSTLFAIVMITMLLAHFTDPGRVAHKWPWDPAKTRVGKAWTGYPTAIALQIERKLDGTPRYCRLCGLYKPDRTHHCRQCKKCTLAMDHHCPYLRNCIGYLNYKYFFLLLFYGCIYCISFCAIMSFKFRQAVQRPLTMVDVFVIFVWFLGIAMCFVIVPFFGLHCWLVYNAYTTVEFCEKYRAKDSKKFKSGQSVASVYRTSLFQKGLYQNICYTLGPNPLFWLIPVRWGMSNNGAAIRASGKPVRQYYEKLNLPVPPNYPAFDGSQALHGAARKSNMTENEDEDVTTPLTQAAGEVQADEVDVPMLGQDQGGEGALEPATCSDEKATVDDNKV